jgi:hypothetical protein
MRERPVTRSLPSKVNLKGYPPQDAVAKDPWARQNPTEYEGNAAIPNHRLRTHKVTFSIGNSNENRRL